MTLLYFRLSILINTFKIIEDRKPFKIGGLSSIVFPCIMNLQENSLHIFLSIFYRHHITVFFFMCKRSTTTFIISYSIIKTRLNIAFTKCLRSLFTFSFRQYLATRITKTNIPAITNFFVLKS